MKVTPDEIERRTASVVRCIRENPGLTAEQIGNHLGDVPARRVRSMIQAARKSGEPISIGIESRGYYYLTAIDDGPLKKATVKAHRDRTRCFMIDHARLLRQIAGMTSEAVAEGLLFDLLVNDEAPSDGGVENVVNSMQDLGRLSMERRQKFTGLLFRLLDGIKDDPQAFAYERSVLGERFKGVFMSEQDLQKMRDAKKLLAEVGF